MTNSSSDFSAFISHASSDAKDALKLVEALEKRGLSCWVAPRNIRPGKEYAEEIIHGLRQSHTLILMLSEAANESPFVRREVERAVHHRKPIFPVRLQSVSPAQSLELFISSTHWVDLSPDSLDAIADKLARELQSVMFPTQAPSGSTTSPPSVTPRDLPTLKGGRSDEVPRTFGKYRLTRLIAESMALVYEAEQQEPKRKVALKIPRGGILLTQESRQRFLREVALTAGIDHGGIVPVLEAGEVEGTPFYTMPLINGVRLDQYIEQEHLNVAQIIRLFISLCEVVGVLHKNNLVHRDLKPANILVDEHHHVRLLDFGLAKVGRTVSDLSMAPSVMGSLEYMAPEQAGAKTAAIGTQADVYAIGVLMYIALTGKRPIQASEQISDMLKRILEAPPPPPRAVNPNIPASLESVILRCLSKRPEDRPVDAIALGQGLTELLAANDTPPPHKRKPLYAFAALVTLGLATIACLLWLIPGENRPSTQAAVTTEAVPVSTTQELETHVRQPTRSQTTPPGGNDSSPAIQAVPQILWDDYAILKEQLRDNFARRNQAAVMIYLPETYEDKLTVNIRQTDRESSRTLAPGDVMEAYVDGRKTVSLTLGLQNRSYSPIAGEVIFIQP
ncbi:protein kinase [Ruficoccus sp. ZRK36]|uniref:protein kinase domain-containing protein n=1 Tax=Ruficoccus sp. ZRK36 TaxID=2866311 RepID=UPI001C72FB39|nr:protein kinase [Ruficoccus sp. ZRK36]QYY37301.1 protein kinase [Ruficoccus sp. ZRK36]